MSLSDKGGILPSGSDNASMSISEEGWDVAQYDSQSISGRGDDKNRYLRYL
jgi:hypothetical protein